MPSPQTAAGSAATPEGPLRVDLSRKHLPPWLAKAMTALIQRLLGFDQFNALYARLPALEPEAFSSGFLEALPARLALAGEPVAGIPAEGALIVVANHPYGPIDGMTTETLLQRVRPDVAIMAIHLLAMIPEYRGRWIFVGRPGSRSKARLSRRGWRHSIQWLAAGHVMVVFPAGRVSRFQWRRGCVADRRWSPHVGALARLSGAPVLPIRLDGPAFWPSHLLGFFLPLLQNIRSLGALDKFRGRTLQARMGRLIPSQELRGFADDEALTLFLRRHVNELAGQG